ncbi:response regulator [Marinomonas sp. IMCC 4694]|uniref:GGDEF domain-containing response regulator n=1 Tax=Marinomonas sp. IMCC 4694 TaxID=2605432 RepID=UPI0011E61B66|nr:response regulator [Marinomonas sp. IMCC 4694]TYL48082.1 response regulator [Marinomonas sp. IMCC 4694]
MSLVKKVLVVEDSPIVLKILHHLLSQSGIFVPVLSACYEDAERHLKQSDEVCFAAIVDLNLPDAANGEIVDLMLLHNIPCIVLTASFDVMLRLSLLNKGVLDYITKESRFSFNNVVKVVERLYKNQGVKVLVAEDSSASRRYIKILLEQYYFNVIEAENGQVALARLETDANIRMLITDYNMPLVNGYDLVKMLRNNSRFQDLVIIGLSAEGDNGLSAKFIKAGANDFLRKPFDHEEFHCRVVHSLEAQEMLETIRDQVNIDPLTELYNRRYLFDEGELWWRNATSSVSLAMLSIDHFKGINDVYGYVVGDRILEAIGKEVRYAFPEMLVCRFAGEVFCVVAHLSESDLLDRLEIFMNQLRSKTFTQAKLDVTFSIGVCGQVAESLDALIRAADHHLTEAKRLGRDRIFAGRQTDGE